MRTLVAVLVPSAASILYAVFSFAVQPGFTAIGGLALIAILPVGIALSVGVCRLLRTRLGGRPTLGGARLIGAAALAASWAASWLLSPILFALGVDAFVAVLHLFATFSSTGQQSTFESSSFYANVLHLGLPAAVGLVVITLVITPLVVTREVPLRGGRWEP